MTAPSSPVPAVEAANDELLAAYDRARGSYLIARTGGGFDIEPYAAGEAAARARVLARMATPTPGRAAEPDTMGEVVDLVDDALRAASAFPHQQEAESYARQAVVDFVRTIVTRAETAEAQLATAEREHEQIALAICGGEDAPGYAASLSVDDLKRVIADRLASKEWTDTQIAALDALSTSGADR